MITSKKRLSNEPHLSRRTSESLLPHSSQASSSFQWSKDVPNESERNKFDIYDTDYLTKVG